MQMGIVVAVIMEFKIKRIKATLHNNLDLSFMT